MSDESEEDRIANRVWLVAIVALVGVLAYGLGWAGWLHGSDTPEPVASANWKPAAEPAGEPSAQAVARAAQLLDAGCGRGGAYLEIRPHCVGTSRPEPSLRAGSQRRRR